MLIAATTIGMAVCCKTKDKQQVATIATLKQDSLWKAPDTTTIPATAAGNEIRYGRDLIANTALYIGPQGSISKQGNGMNCQNCHLEAGTKPWGNNYSSVFSTYPKFRARRGAIETATQRVNDCFERSLNGKTLDSNSREMKAMLAYMQWLGEKVPKNKLPDGCGIRPLSFMNRAADTAKGRLVYTTKCQLCHGAGGEGKPNASYPVYDYPPLWGPHSYNTAAGLYRLSRFAGYVKDNMPQGATHLSPLLTDEEAWDVAAYVNSQPRPHKTFKADWPLIASKPVDHPFGPYSDAFSEHQHKYGPFIAIKKTQELNQAHHTN